MSSVSLERNPQNIKALKHIYKATLWIEKVCYFYLSIRKKKVCFKTLFGNIGNKLKATLKKKTTLFCVHLLRNSKFSSQICILIV